MTNYMQPKHIGNDEVRLVRKYTNDDVPGLDTWKALSPYHGLPVGAFRPHTNVISALMLAQALSRRSSHV